MPGLLKKSRRITVRLSSAEWAALEELALQEPRRPGDGRTAPSGKVGELVRRAVRAWCGLDGEGAYHPPGYPAGRKRRGERGPAL